MGCERRGLARLLLLQAPPCSQTHACNLREALACAGSHGGRAADEESAPDVGTTRAAARGCLAARRADKDVRLAGQTGEGASLRADSAGGEGGADGAHLQLPWAPSRPGRGGKRMGLAACQSWRLALALLRTGTVLSGTACAKGPNFPLLTPAPQLSMAPLWGTRARGRLLQAQRWGEGPRGCRTPFQGTWGQHPACSSRSCACRGAGPHSTKQAQAQAHRRTRTCPGGAWRGCGEQRWTARHVHASAACWPRSWPDGQCVPGLLPALCSWRCSQTLRWLAATAERPEHGWHTLPPEQAHALAGPRQRSRPLRSCCTCFWAVTGRRAGRCMGEGLGAHGGG